MSIHKLPHLIDEPVPDPEPLYGESQQGHAYKLNRNPYRKIQRYDSRPNNIGWNSTAQMWVEVLECGHDGKQLPRMPTDTDGPFSGPFADELRAKRRRCFWCTESGQDAVKRRIEREGR